MLNPTMKIESMPRIIRQDLQAPPYELWSWDVAKLLGPRPWVYFYLYVILDVFSHYVVGWMIAEYG